MATGHTNGNTCANNYVAHSNLVNEVTGTVFVYQYVCHAPACIFWTAGNGFWTAYPRSIPSTLKQHSLTLTKCGTAKEPPQCEGKGWSDKNCQRTSCPNGLNHLVWEGTWEPKGNFCHACKSNMVLGRRNQGVKVQLEGCPWPEGEAEAASCPGDHHSNMTSLSWADLLWYVEIMIAKDC